MENSNNLTLDPSSIRNILTLRYDNNQKSNLPTLSWNDFRTESDNFSLEYIENLISNSIKNQIEDSKISLALSGGIDSTLMLAILKKTLPDVKIEAISMRFASSTDETQLAAQIAEYFDVDHNIIYLENFFVDLPKSISITKLPFWDLHWYHVVKKSQEISKCLVSGDGGDELFGGYTFRYKKFFSLITDNASPIEKVKAYLQCHERDWVEDQEKLFNNKLEFSWNEIYDKLLPYFDNELSPIEQVWLADYNGKLLFNFNPVNTAFHEYFGIKSVTPLLSKNIILYAAHIPSKEKFRKNENEGKIPLRNLLAKFIDQKSVSPTKQGFSVNTVNFWNEYGNRICQDYLSDAQIVKDGWINGDWIKTHLPKTKNKPDVRYVNKFFGLLAFEIWYRIFVTKDMDPETKLN